MDTAEQLFTALIAKRFSHALRNTLSSECVQTIIGLNQSHPNNMCASHNFTDANRLMGTAFTAVMGRPPASYLHEDALYWHDAWRIARSSGFDFTGEVEHLASMKPERETCTVGQLKIRYPQLEEWQSGFEHLALRLRFSDGSYMLLSEEDGDRIPSDDSVEVAVTLFADQGEALCDVSSLPISHVQAFIDYRAVRVSDPQTVYDYFVMEMRAAPGKYSSLDLPLASRCGAVCAEVIDLASQLIRHVNRSYKIPADSYRDADRILTVTRQILNNYIIG